MTPTPRKKPDKSVARPSARRPSPIVAQRSLVVVGSVALDSVETPLGKREGILGGSATYFAYAASFFTPVRLVGVVGKDFPPACLAVLAERAIDLTGLVTKPGRTFRWSGRYDASMNDRETISVELNVFGEHVPEVPAAFRGSDYVFLANCRPSVQSTILDQMTDPVLVVADTMDLWISTTRDELVDLIGRVDGLVLNDGEARMLTGRQNLVQAAQDVRKMGPRFAVIKKGEHGVLIIDDRGLTALPAFPVAAVTDTTGAGDSFAGAMLGYLARTGSRGEPEALRRAVAYGIIVASFNVEDFSLERLRGIDLAAVEGRLDQYRAMLAV